MLSFIILWAVTMIFIRIYLRKFDIQFKDIIAITVSLLLTSFLSIIQLSIDLIINILFR